MPTSCTYKLQVNEMNDAVSTAVAAHMQAAPQATCQDPALQQPSETVHTPGPGALRHAHSV